LFLCWESIPEDQSPAFELLMLFLLFLLLLSTIHAFSSLLSSMSLFLFGFVWFLFFFCFFFSMRVQVPLSTVWTFSRAPRPSALVELSLVDCDMSSKV
jgi:hypothetical protein